MKNYKIIELNKQNIFLNIDNNRIYNYIICKKNDEILYKSNYNQNIDIEEIQNIVNSNWGDGFISLIQYFNSKHEEIIFPEKDSNFNILEFLGIN